MTPNQALLRKPKTIYGYGSTPNPLSQVSLEESIRRFNGIQDHFEEFYRTVEESKLLNAILGLTTNESFLGMTLEEAQRDASFRNSMAGFLHGEHTSYRSISDNLGWFGFYASFFSSTPIPENLQVIERGRKSLELLTAITETDSKFYEHVLKGVYAAELQKQGLLAAENIFISVASVPEVGHEILKPQMVKPGSDTIRYRRQEFYNGLPGDRSRFPTYIVPEGTRIRVAVKNTSTDKVYLIVPTINGIPFHLQCAVFKYDNFKDTTFPLEGVESVKHYLKPGEELILDHFQVDRTSIGDNPKSFTSSDIGDYGSHGSLEELAFVAEPLILEKYSVSDLELLERVPESMRRQIIYESNLGYLKTWLRQLKEAKKTEIYVSRPVLAGKTESSELDNPFLGSLGFTIISVERPPVKAVHTMAFEGIYRESGAHSFSGATKGMGGGIAGLATFSGGSDLGAIRADRFNFDYDSAIHRVIGYYPVNLMSTSGIMRVVQ
ncbi:MAG: hypothetical protein WC254_00155 [Candidatus Woesearchaeota archaeon]|jgi:hypothetical protein